jgi:hypothetical protein
MSQDINTTKFAQKFTSSKNMDTNSVATENLNLPIKKHCNFFFLTMKIMTTFHQDPYVKIQTLLLPFSKKPNRKHGQQIDLMEKQET